MEYLSLSPLTVYSIMLMENSAKEQANYRSKVWYIANKERVLEMAEVRNKKPEVRKQRQEWLHAYANKNRKEIQDRMSAWYAANRTEVKDKARKWKQANPLRAQYLRYKERAKKKSLSFDLEYESFAEFVQLSCVYCGFSGAIVGLDRIDSSQGYVQENVVPCCKVCNYMKLDHKLQDWMQAMRDIFENMGYEITRKTAGDSTL